MTFHHIYRLRPLVLLIAATLAVQGCNDSSGEMPRQATRAPAEQEGMQRFGCSTNWAPP